MSGETEEFVYWRFAKERIPYYYEGNAAFERFASEAAKVGQASNLTKLEFEEGLHHLYEAYFTARRWS